MTKLAAFCIASVCVSVTLTQAFAHSYGPAPRLTTAPGDSAQACTQCHAGTLNSGTGSVKVLLKSGPFYIPGVKQRVTVQVADPNQQRWGFELTARLNSDLQNGQAGDFTPVDNFTQVICEDAGPKPCSSGVTFIQHTSAGTRRSTRGGAEFQFDWTPPSANAGPVTFYLAGNAASGDGRPTGDFIYTSSVELSPAVPAAPSITNVVSAATSAAGPVPPNSWVSIYGSNLSATTRAWSDSDFIDGGIPFSLDGVSVLVTVFGAPRLAYVGYVSPTQVNVLLPSDAAATATQVQVRNPGGISEKVPLTVQANAPALFTLDGTYVWATHADGGLVGKTGLLPSATTTPAAPGETVILYGTGLGTTNPALIPGQLPTDAAGLATLPQVTIGGAAATVVSAGVVPGSAGVYQIHVQVPADAASGDQPVVVQLGTVNSASTLVTIQR